MLGASDDLLALWAQMDMFVAVQTPLIRQQGRPDTFTAILQAISNALIANQLIPAPLNLH